MSDVNIVRSAILISYIQIYNRWLSHEESTLKGMDSAARYIMFQVIQRSISQLHFKRKYIGGLLQI